MDFKIIFQHKISILFVLLNIINGLTGTPVPDTKTKTTGVTEKPKMGCDKKFCTLFNGICTNGGTCVSGDGCAGHCHCTKAYKGRYCQIKIDSDEDNNGHTNGKSSDNGNGNGHDHGNGRSNSRTEKKPTVGVIMKLFKGLRSNGNGNTSNSNTANGGKTLPTSRVPSSSKYSPVNVAAQKVKEEIKTKNYGSGSDILKSSTTVDPRSNTDVSRNVNGSATTKMKQNSENVTVVSTAANSSIVESNTTSTTVPTSEADQENIAGNETKVEVKVQNITITSTTLGISSVETTTRDPGNIQSTLKPSPSLTTFVGNKVTSATDSVKPAVDLHLTMADRTRQPQSNTNSQSIGTEHLTIPSKSKTTSAGILKTKTEIGAGNVDHKTTLNKDATVGNTAGVLPKSDSDSGTGKTLITKITIGSSKTKPELIVAESTGEIPKLKNSEVSSSVIAESAAVPLTLSKGEIFIRDVPVTTRHSNRSHPPRSAAQLWRIHKSSTTNEESALPRISSGTVKSTLDDANRWVASGFEPNVYSDKILRENMALVHGKDFLEEEDVPESKFNPGNIPLDQKGKDMITSQLEITQIDSLTERTAKISRANLKRNNNTDFLPKEIPPKSPLLLSIEKSAYGSPDNLTASANEQSLADAIRPFKPSANNNSIPPLLEIKSNNTATREDITSSVPISTTEPSKANSELPEENIYLKAAVYKKFIPPNEASNSEKSNNTSNTVAPTTVVNAFTKSNMEHEGGKRVLESNIQSSTMTSDMITTHASSVADTTPSKVVKDSDDIPKTLGNTLKNGTGVSKEDTTVTALEKLKSLLVYVQTILSSTKSELDARKANNAQSVNTAQNIKENTTHSQPDTAGSLEETAPVILNHNKSETEQESKTITTDFNNQQQQEASDATTETAFVLETKAFEITTPKTPDSTPDDMYDTNEDTLITIPIFHRASDNIMNPTMEPVTTSTGDGMLKSKSSSRTTGVSEEEASVPRRHISTSAMARILRKIYAIGNLITRPAIKPTTTVIPASSDTEQRASSPSESPKISHTFDTVPSKMSAVNIKQQNESDSSRNPKSDRQEQKVRSYSKKDKYFQPNKTVRNEMDSFYGNEDMVGNYIVDSTSTMKPYTLPPTTDPQDGELFRSINKTDDRSFNKQQSDTELKQRTNVDSVNLSSLETMPSITTVSPKTENTTIS